MYQTMNSPGGFSMVDGGDGWGLDERFFMISAQLPLLRNPVKQVDRITLVEILGP